MNESCLFGIFRTQPELTLVPTTSKAIIKMINEKFINLSANYCRELLTGVIFSDFSAFIRLFS